MSSTKTVGIIGNPNVGKTYLFNRMTACVGCVGNWAGVTSTTCESRACGDDSYRILDLPGCYHLEEGHSIQTTEGQQEVASWVEGNTVDLWLNVLDVNNLQQQLYLTIQLLEANQQVICVINRIDLLADMHKTVDITALSRFLQVPVVKISAKLGLGMHSLQALIKTTLVQASQTPITYPVTYPRAIEQLLSDQQIEGESRWQVWRKLTQADQQAIAPAWHFEPGIAELRKTWGTITDIMTLARANQCEQWCQTMIRSSGSERKDHDKALDKWFLHPWLGLPLFFLMMFAVFWLSMGCGQLLQAMLEPILQLLTIKIPSMLCQQYALPLWLEIILVQGIGTALVTALSFFPILLVMFFALYWLEESGYMTRAAVVMDRVMRQLDLPGESMVALVLGLGCNVPGILATRHIPKQTDKIVTALMMPFMSCGARLTIFAVFSSVFFPHQAASVLFFLYVLGIMVAFITGLLARYCGLTESQEQAHYLLEIPGYQWPSWSMGIQQAYQRSRRFVWRALGVIVPVCIVLALCNHITYTGAFLTHPGEQSILAWIGKALSRVFYPIGLRAEHWPLVVSLCMGLLAKEVVLTTLSVFYTQMQAPVLQNTSIFVLIQDCGQEILQHIMQAHTYFWPSLTAEMPAWSSYLNPQHIAPEVVMSYLIFTLLYFPCISTLYATARQTSWRWAYVSVLWSTAVAYSCAAGYLYLRRVMTTQVWEVIILATVLLLGYMLKERIKKRMASRRADDASGQLSI